MFISGIYMYMPKIYHQLKTWSCWEKNQL